MKLRADVLAQRLEELVDEGPGRSSGVDRTRDLPSLPSSSGRSEELDVAERLVEDRALLGAGARAGAHDLPPGVGEREHLSLATLRKGRAANSEESRDDLREDDHRST
jgi:hypothetical protein